MRPILIITLFIFFIHSSNNTHSNYIFGTIYKNIENTNWQIESIVIKQNTNNPDEIVQDNQVTIIDSGNTIKGVIYLKSNKTITIKNNHPQFYLNFYDQYQWELIDNNFIQFKRYGDSGRIVQSFGFNVRFTSEDKMQWFSESIGIESGRNSVIIITFYNK